VAALEAASLRLFPRRGSDLASAVRSAHRLLVDARPASNGVGLDASRPSEVIVVLSGSVADGPRSGVIAAASAARGDGIVIAAVAYGGSSDAPLLEEMASARALYYVEGLSSRLPGLYRQIAADIAAVRPTGAEVVDVLPDDMEYVWGSGVPAPRTRGRQLSWAYAVWPAHGITITYSVVPQVAGHRATNATAAITVTFDRGARALNVLPVPEVDVLPPTATPSATRSGPATTRPPAVTAVATPSVVATTSPPPGGTPVKDSTLWLPYARVGTPSSARSDGATTSRPGIERESDGASGKGQHVAERGRLAYPHRCGARAPHGRSRAGGPQRWPTTPQCLMRR
jgi:hypothetical protein